MSELETEIERAFNGCDDKFVFWLKTKIDEEILKRVKGGKDEDEKTK